MSYTLDFYFYKGANRATEPVEVRTESDLKRTLAAILEEPQPHPTQIAARELPRFGPAKIPDRMFKLDLSPAGEYVALHYFGPKDVQRAVRLVKHWVREDLPEQARPTRLQIELMVMRNVGRTHEIDVDTNSPQTGGLDVALERRAWVTYSEDIAPGDVPTLYVDTANETEFPRNAIIPAALARAALLEFAQTGVRPESVQWQPFETY
ncbi:Imm1 family immunity protein [Nocardia sp. NRRL S-836]|uniref:Imm1 family immunity protein n=1 Tax=Nocardia sp. NRRL S-836 TaxID=1519492 RepID=UPI0006AF2BCA|nr:Imm1 family immunity protein [Nocardia sp. NRRL S-836]KOV83110.1 hypothetical protein ADL03_21290 [Nocardia sp. NRRL S-836]